LRDEILSGKYLEGDRLPPFRKLAQLHGVSIFTIHRSLAELSKEGIVKTREGAATLVGKVNGRLASQELVPRVRPVAIESMAPIKIVRWMRQDSSFRKLRLAILEKNFESTNDCHKSSVQDKWLELSGESFQNEVFRAFLTGVEPTCAIFNRTHMSVLDSYQSLSDFSSELSEEDSARLQAFLGELDPLVLEQVAPQLGTMRRVLMLPTVQSFGAILYNRSQLAAAGLPDRAPRTWEEFHHVLATLERVNGRPPMTIQDHRSIGWLFAQFCYQLSDIPQGDPLLRQLDYTAQEAAPAFDLLIKLLFQKPLIQISKQGEGDAVFSRLLAGELPVFFAPTSEAAQLAAFGEADRFLLGLVPTHDGAPSTNLMNIAGWVLNAHAPVASLRAASSRLIGFVSWLHTQDGGAQMDRLSIARSLFSVFSKPERDGACQRPLPDSWIAAVKEAERTAKWEPQNASFEYEGIGQCFIGLKQSLGSEVTTAVLREACRVAQKHSVVFDAIPPSKIAFPFSNEQ
jgi:hypothetical protein